MARAQSSGPAFASLAKLDAWLAKHHAFKTELWVQIFKKESGVASVTWKDCVVAALMWGWIDGQKQALDEHAFLQRLTPRRAKSGWSRRNCELAEQLITQGHMQPAGLAQVDAAKQDGRWAKAYAGSATMEMPEDFLRALRTNKAAARAFKDLKRSALFSIYHQLQTAKRDDTRQRRIAKILADLSES